jgi:hypothetical protein
VLRSFAPADLFLGGWPRLGQDVGSGLDEAREAVGSVVELVAESHAGRESRSSRGARPSLSSGGRDDGVDSRQPGYGLACPCGIRPGLVSIDSLEVTGSEGGETYGRFAVHGRLNWQNMPLQRLPRSVLRSLSSPAAGRRAGGDRVPCSDRPHASNSRHAGALGDPAQEPPSAAEEARRKLLKGAKKKGGKVNPRTLEAADYFFVLTSVPAEDLTAAQVLEVYRYRWQIEMTFKRLKEILPLRRIPAKDPDFRSPSFRYPYVASDGREDIWKIAARSSRVPNLYQRRPTLTRSRQILSGAESGRSLCLLWVCRLVRSGEHRPAPDVGSARRTRAG